MKSRTDIYGFDAQLKGMGKYIENLGTSRHNKAIIARFGEFCHLQNFSKPRIIKYYYCFKYWAEFIGKDFDQAAKKDIERTVALINTRENWSCSTKHDLKVMLKRFYKWLYGNNEEYPEEVKWIKSRIKRTDKKLPNDGELLTEQDILKAIDHALNIRDKALISALYESGCRVGELASLRIKDVSFDKFGTVLSITGKTGPRQVRVVSSTPHLATWINNHPLKNDREAAVWVCIGSKCMNQKMDYETIRMMIHKVFRRAGIQKRHNPHTFRHSRATFLANHLTEFQMNQYFGWVQGSDMAKGVSRLSVDASKTQDLKESEMIDRGLVKRSDILEVRGIDEDKTSFLVSKNGKIQSKIPSNSDRAATKLYRILEKIFGLLS